MKTKTRTSPKKEKFTIKLEQPNDNKINQIVDSLKEIVRTLSFVSYKAAEDSGDYKNSGNGGYRGIYKLYWQNEYQFIFFSFFYTLNSELRNEPSLAKTAKDSLKIYNQYLADKVACKKASLERKRPSERIKALRVFDGKKMIKPKAMTLNDLLPLMKASKTLLGWEQGLPPHLSHLGDRPVIKN